MANENNEISDIVKKCKILLLDIEGTTTSISFVKDKLFPYAAENVKEFLETKWEEDDVKEVVAALRKLALEDQEKSVEGVVTIPGEDASKEEQIVGLVNNVKWQMSSDRKAGPLKQLQGLIWKQGYDKGDIKGHVYDDVLPALEQWRSVEGHKIYIYSSGSVQAQKLLFGLSSAGDLLPHIDGHFDTAVGAKQEEASYKAIAEKIDCKTDEILFLTDIVEEAAACRSAGVHAALVSRAGNAPLSAAAAASYPVLHSFQQLAATNKRKPDTQDEQPAKVPKTEADGDVKSIVEETVDKAPEVAEKLAEPESEKMEVDDTPVEVKESKSDNVVVTTAEMHTVVEKGVDKSKVLEQMEISDNNIVGDKTEANSEVKKAKAQSEFVEKLETETVNKAASDTEVDTKVVDSAAAKPEDAGKTDAEIIVADKIEVVKKNEVNENEIINKNEMGDKNEVNAPVVEIKPVVDEVVEKPKEKEVENMDTEPIVEEGAAEDVVNNVNDKIDIKNGEDTVSIAEETPTVITEIEDITEDKQILNEVAEIIEDIEPVIEEPTIAEDIEDLKNVGDVLEKECDEILSKVQDVTNLDSIPIKPLLNTIAEETMDTENTDSNDIVDRILDTEMELGMKQCEDIPVTITPCEDIPVTMTSTEDVPVNTEKTEIKADMDEKSKQAEPDAVVMDEKPIEKVTVENKEETKKMDTDCTTVTVDDKTNKHEVVKSETVVESRACSDEKKSEIENSKMTAEETKTETEVNTDKIKPNTMESKTIEKCAVEDSAEAKKDVEVPETVNKGLPVESSTENVVAEANEVSAEEVKVDSEITDAQINGNTNGESATVNLNGDASSEEALSSRLQVENGKGPVNGSNGDSVEEQGQGDNKVETVSDIKVKTVATDETRSDPIEQPTEA